MQSGCTAKLLILCAVTLIAALAAGPRTRAESSAVDQDQFRKDVAALCASPSRVIGTSGYAAAQEYLRSQIGALGPNVELREHEFPVMAPVTQSATIDLRDGRVEKIYPFWPAMVRVCSTSPDGIIGKLVYAGECRFDQIKPASMAGAIAVIE